MTYMKKHIINYDFYGLAYKLSDYLSNNSLQKLYYESYVYKKHSSNKKQLNDFNTLTYDLLTDEQVTESAKTVLNKYISDLENSIKATYLTESLNTEIKPSKYNMITKNKDNKQYYYTQNQIFPIKRSTIINKKYNYSKTIKQTKLLLRTRKSITLIKKTHNFFKALLNKFEKNDDIVSVFKRKFRYTNEPNVRRLKYYRRYHRSRLISISAKKLLKFQRTRKYRKLKKR